MIGEIEGIRGLLSDLSTGVGPKEEKLAKLSPFWKSCLKAMEVFCVLGVETADKTSGETSIVRMSGRDAILSHYKACDSATKALGAKGGCAEDAPAAAAQDMEVAAWRSGDASGEQVVCASRYGRGQGSTFTCLRAYAWDLHSRRRIVFTIRHDGVGTQGVCHDGVERPKVERGGEGRSQEERVDVDRCEVLPGPLEKQGLRRCELSWA